MKKMYLLAICTFMVGIFNSEAQQFNLGAKGGLNVSTFYGNRSDNQIERNSLIGYHFGFLAETKLSENIALQPELLFSRAGAEEGNVVKFYLDYITIPVMLKFYVGDNFSLDFGPQFGFLVNDKAKFNNDSLPEFDTDAETFDLSLNGGLTTYLTEAFFAQLRYGYGITTVGENPDIRNGVLQISLGYKF